MKNNKFSILVLGCLLIVFSAFVQTVYAQETTPQKPKSVMKTQKQVNVQTKAMAAASRAEYVGAKKCSACHPTEFKDFEKRKFNKAWKILKMRGEDKNAECLQCHVTGFGRGGFVSEEKTPNLVGKQCEACHGPGGNHISNPGDAGFKQQMAIGQKKNVCIECHACMTTHKAADF